MHKTTILQWKELLFLERKNGTIPKIPRRGYVEDNN